jgi:hypothetical protein
LAIQEVISENNCLNKEILELTDEIIKFKYFRVSNIFDMSFKEYTCEFKYDINNEILKISEDVDTDFNPSKVRYDKPKNLHFRFADSQKSMIKSYSNLFGNNLAGLSKTLSRVYLKQFFREAILK